MLTMSARRQYYQTLLPCSSASCNSLRFRYSAIPNSRPCSSRSKTSTPAATIPARFPAWLSGHAPLESAFVPLLTSMFLHSGVLHIAGNMLFLWIFGDNVEDFYGHFTYLFFYLFCGVGSGLLHVAFNMTSAVPALGASGAISGVMGAYLILYPRSQILTLVFVFLVPIPAVIILGLWFIMQFTSAFSSLGSVASGGVAWWAHVGGFLLGMLITTMARSQQRSARWQ